MLVQRRDRGDTIIEVMIAFVVFSMVSVLSFAIMNHGVAISQRALEVAQVRAQMDAQANALRFMHQQRVAEQAGSASDWDALLDRAKPASTGATSFSNMVSGTTCAAFTPSQGQFILNARTAKISSSSPAIAPPAGGTLPPYPQVRYNASNAIDQAYGIWIEAVRGPVSTGFVDYVDFHIRACWQTVGTSVPATLGTIVRLYDPVN